MPTPVNATVRFGLAYEKMRLEAATYNLAIANVPQQAGFEARLKGVSVPASPDVAPMLVALPVAAKQVHEPSNALADAQGMVRYADVDATTEMATLVSATRAYEANVRAFNALQQMDGKALDIGGRR